MMGEHSTENGALVCIAHGRFIPCRKDGEHRYSGNPYWVKAVNDYQISTVEGLTWEPAYLNSTRIPPPQTRCSDCGMPGQCASCYLMETQGVPTPPRVTPPAKPAPVPAQRPEAGQ